MMRKILYGFFSNTVLPAVIGSVVLFSPPAVSSDESAPKKEIHVFIERQILIATENGEEVYGSAYVSREFAVQHGMAGYARDLEAGKASARVSDRPFTVKGLRTTVPGGSDFVVSNSDAAKIRSSSENLSFLRKCRVVIVLD